MAEVHAQIGRGENRKPRSANDQHRAEIIILKC